jgi:hypothetical protein
VSSPVGEGNVVMMECQAGIWPVSVCFPVNCVVAACVQFLGTYCLRHHGGSLKVLRNDVNTLRTGLLNCLNARSRGLTFRHRASCI